MVGYFDRGRGNHATSTYRNNAIASSNEGCPHSPTGATGCMAFGLIAGHQPWWVIGGAIDNGFVQDAGSITDNQISGAVVNLAVQGVGRGTISNNTLSNRQGNWAFNQCRGTQSTLPNYAAHFYGEAVLQSGWTPYWFFPRAPGTPYEEGCGPWDPSKGRPDERGALSYNEVLATDNCLLSQSGNYCLNYQAGDGNLVLYRLQDGQWVPAHSWMEHEPRYIPHTAGTAVMQDRGNFVVFGSDTARKWDTQSDGRFGAYLLVQDDGQVVVYDIHGEVLWAIGYN